MPPYWIHLYLRFNDVLLGSHKILLAIFVTIIIRWYFSLTSSLMCQLQSMVGTSFQTICITVHKESPFGELSESRFRTFSDVFEHSRRSTWPKTSETFWKDYLISRKHMDHIYLHDGGLAPAAYCIVNVSVPVLNSLDGGYGLKTADSSYVCFPWFSPTLNASHWERTSSFLRTCRTSRGRRWSCSAAWYARLGIEPN